MVDATYEIIVAAELFTTHQAQPPTFLPTYRRAKDIIGQHPRALGADAVFDTVAIERALADDGVNVFIPVWRRPGPSADLFGQERFTLHDDGRLTCPAGQPMTFLYQRSYDAARVFRGQGCPTCALRSQCTHAKGDRKLYLHPSLMMFRLSRSMTACLALAHQPNRELFLITHIEFHTQYASDHPQRLAHAVGYFEQQQLKLTHKRR